MFINNENKNAALVVTPYGIGRMISYRDEDQTYIVDLKSNMTLFCKQESILASINAKSDPVTAKGSNSRNHGMDLNTAYESLETMRKLNLELTCQDKGILFQTDLHHLVCADCLLETAEKEQQQKQIQLESKKQRELLKQQKLMQKKLQNKEPIENNLLPNVSSSFSLASFLQKKPKSSIVENDSTSKGQNEAPKEIKATEDENISHKIEMKQQQNGQDTEYVKTIPSSQNQQQSDYVDDPVTGPSSILRASSTLSDTTCSSAGTSDFTITGNLVSPGSDSGAIDDGSSRSSTVRPIFVAPDVRKLKKSPPCLVCNTPCCKNHSSQSWRKFMHITLCTSCESVFGIQYITTILTAPSNKERQKSLDRLMDMYDRIVLVLRYSSEYIITDLSDQLDERLTRRHKWGIGSSSAGMISGVLGLAATAAFFTPAGPPLMIASLIFGGSASAVQTGADVGLHYSEPHKMANRILALNATMMAIIRVVNTIRDALVLDQLHDLSLYMFEDENYNVSGSDRKQKLSLTSAADLLNVYDTNRVGILTSVTATRSAAALVSETSAIASAAEMSAMAGKNARFMSRGGVAAASSASSVATAFAQFAGGTLAAATLLLEAHTMKRTLETYNDGCSKAKQLRNIKIVIDASFDSNRKPTDAQPTIVRYDNTGEEYVESVATIPTTKELDSECQNYMTVLSHRIRVMTEEEVTKLLLEQNEQLDLEEGNEDDDFLDRNENVGECLVSEAFEKGTNTSTPNDGNYPSKLNAAEPNDKDKKMLTPASRLLKRIEKYHRQKVMMKHQTELSPSLDSSTVENDNNKNSSPIITNGVDDDMEDIVLWTGKDNGDDHDPNHRMQDDNNTVLSTKNAFLNWNNNHNSSSVDPLAETEIYCDDNQQKHNNSTDQLLKLTV